MNENENLVLDESAENVEATTTEEIVEQVETVETEPEKVYTEEEFNNKIELFEKEFIDIFINLCEKLFGIIIDDKQDVLLHVINRTITDLEKSNNYIIRVTSITSHINCIVTINLTIKITI